MSIFEDSFNPQAAIDLTTVYNRILAMCKAGSLSFQKIILGIAFKEPILFKMLKFIDVYCGIDDLLPH